MSEDSDACGSQQGPPSPPHPHHFGFLLERHSPKSIIRVLDMFTANGHLADYDDELANRVHDAREIVEKAPRLADALVQLLSLETDPRLTVLIVNVLTEVGIDPVQWKPK
jgi:hypothetical protein